MDVRAMVNCRAINRGSNDLAKHTTLELVVKMKGNDNEARLSGQTALSQFLIPFGMYPKSGLRPC